MAGAGLVGISLVVVFSLLVSWNDFVTMESKTYWSILIKGKKKVKELCTVFSQIFDALYTFLSNFWILPTELLNLKLKCELKFTYCNYWISEWSMWDNLSFKIYKIKNFHWGDNIDEGITTGHLASAMNDIPYLVPCCYFSARWEVPQ